MIKDKKGKRAALNGAIFLILYGLAFHDAFLNKSSSGFLHGELKGVVIFIPLLILFIAIATIYYTRKNGGDSNKVKGNLQHNFLGLVSFEWFERKKRSK